MTATGVAMIAQVGGSGHMGVGAMGDCERGDLCHDLHFERVRRFAAAPRPEVTPPTIHAPSRSSIVGHLRMQRSRLV
jgi:hypothetical protein